MESRSPKGGKTKLHIVKEVIRLIAEEGIEKLSYDNIDRRLGMGKGHVAYHFTSRKSLIEHSLEYMVSCATTCIEETMRKPMNNSSALESYVDGNYSWLKKFPEQGTVMMLYFHYCGYDPDYRQTQKEVLERGRSRVEEILSSQIQNLGAERIKVLSRSAHNIVMAEVILHITTKNNWRSSKQSCKQQLRQLLQADSIV